MSIAVLFTAIALFLDIDHLLSALVQIPKQETVQCVCVCVVVFKLYCVYIAVCMRPGGGWGGWWLGGCWFAM